MRSAPICSSFSTARISSRGSARPPRQCGRNGSWSGPLTVLIEPRIGEGPGKGARAPPSRAVAMGESPAWCELCDGCRCRLSAEGRRPHRLAARPSGCPQRRRGDPRTSHPGASARTRRRRTGRSSRWRRRRLLRGLLRERRARQAGQGRAVGVCDSSCRRGSWLILSVDWIWTIRTVRSSRFRHRCGIRHGPETWVGACSRAERASS